MLYKEFKGMKLSALGMGTVRLPLNSEDSGDVDIPQVDEIIDAAMAQGINYYDMGYDYHNFKAEKIVGTSLQRYPRESYFVADKFPLYHPDKLEHVEEVFEEQLRDCCVDYFDFYLIHNVCELTLPDCLNPKYGILEFLLKQKEAGRIRHLGFSTHGEVENIQEFLDTETGRHMEFCQIQLNWLDWTFQRAKEKVELLTSRGLPVWVMEPLRGGKLLNLAQEDVDTLKAIRPDETVYSWGLRFLQTVPEVTMVLSGLSSVKQAEENTATFSETKPLNQTEWDALQKIAEKMIAQKILPCTGCRYCMSHCPQKLNIPKLLDTYKLLCLQPTDFIAPRALLAMPLEQRADACIGCRGCERVCPQGIKISEALVDFVDRTDLFFQMRGVDISGYEPFRRLDGRPRPDATGMTWAR